ncbi:MAG TPA: DUF1080 domain-containing protein [Planctomycetota bacterium]|nr:DUF1080 domain-containing protein [Planctomycetota bacterium]
MKVARTCLLAMAAMGLVVLSGCRAAGPATTKEAPKAKETVKAAEKAKPLTPTTVPPGEWFSMCDGKSLKGWKTLKEDSFSLAGKVVAKDGAIVLGEGMAFTGIQWEGEFPKEGFEVRWDGCRQNGIDIFGGLTVPVGNEHVTFVPGGWGDSVVGLSSIDDRNASDNEQTKIMSFKNNQWYEFCLRVTKAKIEAWIDDKQVIDLERKGHKFTVYDELMPCRPVGFFSWSTEGAVRNIEMQRLKAN